MEWMWAAISVAWTLGASFIAKSGWLLAKSWAETGVIDNGMSFMVRREERPFLFALACNFSRFVALLGVLFVLIGIAVTMGWIARAI